MSTNLRVDMVREKSGETGSRIFSKIQERVREFYFNSGKF